MIAYFGYFLGSYAPINVKKHSMYTYTLTFDDTTARLAFGWNLFPVFDCFKIQLDAK